MRYLLFLLCLYSYNKLNALPVEPILVTDQTLKIQGEKRLFFAFEMGDEILLSIKMKKGKWLKQVVVLPYQKSQQYQGLQVEGLQQKLIRVPKRAVYEFRFTSGGAKQAQIKIQRIPYSAARADFDTHVAWKTVTDTIRRQYKESIKVWYDTTFVTRYRKVLKRIDTSLVSLVERSERIHARTNLTQDNTASITWELPKAEQRTWSKKRILSWAYWIGVGQEGTENYNKEVKQFLRSTASKVIQQNLLAGIALGLYSVVYNPPNGEDVDYTLTQIVGAQETALDAGSATRVFGRVGNHTMGKIQLNLSNNNLINGINVHIKALAVTEQRIYRQEGYQVREIKTLEEKDIKGRVQLRKRAVPIINNW